MPRDPAKIVEVLAKYHPNVRSQYHIQFPAGPRGCYHDLWLPKSGELKFKPFGARQARILQGTHEIHRFFGTNGRNLHHQASDLEMMSLSARIKGLKFERGVYCDAGYKDGRARIVVIAKQQYAIDVLIRDVIALNSTQAEEMAVLLAMDKFKSLVIYTDCKSIADKYPHIQWIGRGRNKEADRLANMRR